MFQKTKGKTTKEFTISTDDASTLARLVTGRELAQREYNYKMAGYETELNNLMSEIEKKLSIDTEKNTVDWQTVLKDQKIYVTPKEDVVVNSGTEETKSDGEQKNQGEDKRKTGKKNS